MLNIRFLYIVIALLFTLSGKLLAQLSPGELSAAHKDLEGVANCTKCHEIGNKVSNAKCLSCHQEIKGPMDAGRGFHNTAEVRAKDCAKCHNDHHGRRFDMVRFDEKNFNHSQTGYELTGAHKKIDCRQCHKPDYIEDANIRKRPETFLGLKQQCLSCHKDKHQKTLGNDCAKCHVTDAFAPASKFNHEKTSFPLAGKHKNVQCVECHKKEQRNGDSFQNFADVPAKNCNNCHSDPHKNNLGTNCKECHQEQGFEMLNNLNRFNHTRTHFPLKGQHKQVDCKSCHNMAAASPLTVFQDRLGIETSACQSCHKDVHDGQFGLNCAECHQEDGFKKLRNLNQFDHNRTHFPLQGKHQVVDCRKCHVSENMTDPLPHNTCAACHQDYHQGQFSQKSPVPDCASCHNVNGFDESSYGPEQHALSKFPLDGAHMATPCFACHKQQDKWTFRSVGEKCADCHKDVHEGEIDPKWYPVKSCDRCHQTSAWQDNHFDHNQTAFSLKGAHKNQACNACHKPTDTFKHGRFAGTSTLCAACHEDQHMGQFMENGQTDCARCHGLDSWKGSSFDHSRTRFKLEGKHAVIACDACHKPILKGNTWITQYKFERYECSVCHN